VAAVDRTHLPTRTHSGHLLVATSISVESKHGEINNNDESSLSDLHEALVGYIGDALADHPAASVVQCRVSSCHNHSLARLT
jgi:hypothetical protein